MKMEAMEAKDWISLVSIIATVTLAIVTLLVSRRREKHQQERDDRLRKDQQAREDSLREKGRIDFPQVEFNIDCNFYGPQQDEYLVEVLLTVHNMGHVKHELKDVRLRIRGIKENQKLEYWEDHGHRLKFPEKLVPSETEVGQFFAEPGEKHVITYVTKIPASIKYISAYARHSFGADKLLHDTERVFPVKAR
ncbi:MAG: hypothetical protein ACJ74W_08615 [Pyrinomonadaceae bacterium]